jgi:hypothetical protein
MRCGSGSDGSSPINCIKKLLGIKKLHKMKQLIYNSFSSVHIFSNINRTESNEKDSFNISLNFSTF